MDIVKCLLSYMKEIEEHRVGSVARRNNVVMLIEISGNWRYHRCVEDW